MQIHPTDFHAHNPELVLLIFYGKVVAAVGTLCVALSYLYKKLVSPVVKRVTHISSTVDLLASNHIPHLEMSMKSQEETLRSQDVVLGELKMDVRDTKEQIEKYGEGLSETKNAVGTLQTALMNHLEHNSMEVSVKTNAPSDVSVASTRPRRKR